MKTRIALFGAVVLIGGLVFQAAAQSPVILTQPTNQAVLVGGTATFSVAISGPGPFTFQWRFGGTNLPLLGSITTMAGNGTRGFSGDGGAATNAALNSFSGLAADASGNIFLAEYGDNRIRKVDTNGIVTTVAGNGLSGYSGDGGAATNARLNLNYPPGLPAEVTVKAAGVAVDSAGNLFIADSGNNVIRKADTNGIITTVAGNHFSGGQFAGDGGPATNASLFYPSGVAVDGLGNLFLADEANHRVRRVGTDGLITTVAGNGAQGWSGDGGAATNANLNYPDGLAVDRGGNLFIAEYGDSRIRKVDANGVITTLAGSFAYGYSGDGVAATNAGLAMPSGLAADAFGNLFIGDGGDNRVRRLADNGIITTLAGNGTNAYSGDGGAATNASLWNPTGVALDGFGNLFVADSGNSRIRKVTFLGTASTLVLNQIGAANAGDYDLVIANPSDSVTSSIVRLEVLFPPAFTHWPEAQAAVLGGAASFSVAASGTAPLAYQWWFQGAPLDNETNATLLIRNVAATNAGRYTVVVTNLYGSITNAQAWLTVDFPPAIVTQPASQTNLGGATATFSVAVSGTGPFAYNWQRIGTNLLLNGVISTVAGGGLYSPGDGGPATNARLKMPTGVAVDAAGNLFIADLANVCVRKVTPNGIITTVAGGGTNYPGDGGPATSASLGSTNLSLYEFPPGVALDGSGNLFIADLPNERIRKVDLNGIITTVAGGGTNSPGDGGPATNASLVFPAGVAVDGFGNVFIADTGRGLVRKVDLNGTITTVAGGGSILPPNYGTNYLGGYGTNFVGDGGPATNAILAHPSSVAVDVAGNLFIADSLHNRVRMVDTNGIITTIAGGDPGQGGLATNAILSFPTSVAVDQFGTLFIADNWNFVIRQAVPGGIIITVAGNGISGYSGDGGLATNAELNGPTALSGTRFLNFIPPMGVAVDSFGGLFIADSGNSRVRKVDLHGHPTLTLPSLSALNEGDYRVIVTSPYGSVTSAVATLTVLAPPLIVKQPVDGFVPVGSTAVLEVAAFSPQPVFYSWYFNATNPIPGGTNSTLSLPVAGLADAGGYEVVISNLFGSVTSRVAVLSVGFSPTLLAEPASQANWAGGNATLTVAPTGGGPYHYQWRQNGVDLANNLITTVAGGGVGDGGLATNASLFPRNVAVDAVGNLFIADYGNNRIRKMDTNGMITTVAGGSTYGYYGDGGPATNASLSRPSGVVVDAFGNLFIADYGNYRIRKVDTNGVITTVAGNGTYGASGDGGPATGAELVQPSGVAVDAFGNLFIADYGNSRIRKVDPNGIITTVAGNGTNSYSGDGGAATNAGLRGAYGVAVDAWGNLFITDSGNYRVRRVDTKGIITTVAGNGNSGYSGNGGSATNATLAYPTGVGVDGFGNLFIADEYNNRIRKVDTNGIITTVAGNGIYGYSGDGGAATNASLKQPLGLVVDAAGNLFIADPNNGVIRKVDVNGIITSVAGGGVGDGGLATNAYVIPRNMAADSAGNLFIADRNNHRVRKMDPAGIITTVAGIGTNGYSGDGGPAASASLNSPAGVALDAFGNLLIADSSNQRIRKVGTNGLITTVAGTGISGYSGDGGQAGNARLASPAGLAVDASGNLFIADAGNNVIRRVATNGIISTVAGSNSFGAGYSGDGGPAVNARLFQPSGVAVDAGGNLLIADYYNGRIRKVAGGLITTVAGNGTPGYSGDGGPATSAGLNFAYGVALDAAGNMYIADGNNMIRKVDVHGIITTEAGNGTNGYSGDGGPANQASLWSPQGVAVDPSGNLLIADSGNGRVRKVWLAGLPLQSFSNLSPANGGDYQVIITNPYGSVTSSVATVTVNLPSLNATFNTAGVLSLSSRGAPDSVFVLQAASALTPPVNWQPVFTNSVGTNGDWTFSLTNVPANSARFYRLTVP